MRVVRFLIQPIWSRRASLCAVPSALTVLPAAAAMAREAPERLPSLIMVLTPFMNWASWESGSRFLRASQSRPAPAAEFHVSAAEAKRFSCRSVALSRMSFPSRLSVASW